MGGKRTYSIRCSSSRPRDAQALATDHLDTLCYAPRALQVHTVGSLYSVTHRAHQRRHCRTARDCRRRTFDLSSRHIYQERAYRAGVRSSRTWYYPFDQPGTAEHGIARKQYRRAPHVVRQPLVRTLCVLAGLGPLRRRLVSSRTYLSPGKRDETAMVRRLWWSRKKLTTRKALTENGDFDVGKSFQFGLMF